MTMAKGDAVEVVFEAGDAGELFTTAPSRATARRAWKAG
jgi:hypothetical protein